MANAVVIGIAGESGLWLADLESGTVTPLSEPLSGGIATAIALRQQGVSVVKGVDVAIAVSSAADVAASHHEG